MDNTIKLNFRMFMLAAVAPLALLIPGAQAQEPAVAAKYSKLWGRSGELWQSTGRLPDFSYAGYRHGEKPLPELPYAVNVRDFGAKGDGETDDSAAFLKAIAAVESGAIEIPAGRYRITQILEITRPNIVLRGAGTDQTILFFPQPLNEVRPNWGATTGGQRTSNYSWSGGFIWLRGDYRSAPLTTVAAPAQRGDTTVTVAAAAPLRIGQQIEIRQSDTEENSLAQYLYSDDAGPVNELKARTSASQICTITAIEGERVHLNRPLRFELRAAWKPEVHTFEPTVTGSGVEQITFEFPADPYRGHFTELGFNPIALNQVAHCWVRDVRILNADSGPMVTGYFNTLQGLVYESSRLADARNQQGHHGITLRGGDNLFIDFDIRMRFIHDLTVTNGSVGNVFARGRGTDLSLDHHRRAPYENLFTEIDAGAGTRIWKSGGGKALGRHAAARNTYWNIRAARVLPYPPANFGPSTLNLVGLHMREDSIREHDGRWIESIQPEELHPPNLYEAQRAHRLLQTAS